MWAAGAWEKQRQAPSQDLAQGTSLDGLPASEQVCKVGGTLGPWYKGGMMQAPGMKKSLNLIPQHFVARGAD
eukprot:12881256-Prorocentrum_lima.AAC.1